MRILFINPGGDASGGAERSLSLLIRGLTEHGHETAVLLLLPGNAAESFAQVGAVILANGIVHDLGAVRRHGSLSTFVDGAMRSVGPAITSAREIRNLADSFGADLIHTNGLRAHVLTPLIFETRRPVIWSLRERPPGLAACRILRIAARRASAITAPSYFAAALASGCRRPVYVIPNPVERLTLPDVTAARNALSIEQDRPTAAVIAHLHPTKGHHIALAAWQLLPSPRPLLLLAGGDLYGEPSRRFRASLIAEIERSGLKNDVLMLGIVEPRHSACDLSRGLRAIDC
jgi:glycosyltransferase involved in cell wall biosynthesis